MSSCQNEWNTKREFCFDENIIRIFLEYFIRIFFRLRLDIILQGQKQYSTETKEIKVFD